MRIYREYMGMGKAVLFTVVAMLVACHSAVAAPAKKFLTLEDAAVAQAKKWQQTGVAKPIISDDGRINYPFGQYLPKLTCTIIRACDIQLEPGEVTTGAPVAGDTARWKLSKRVSGAGETAVTHIIVKPTDVGIATNLIVTTNKRTYQIDLVSSETGSYLNMIGFYYPEDIAAEWDDSAKLKDRERRERERLVAAELPAGSVDQIDFAYSIDGDASIRPVRVFNRMGQVYIQLQDDVVSKEAPVLMLVDKDDKYQIVNWRAETPTLWVVDKLFDKAVLVIGVDGDQRKATITWTKNKRSFWSRAGGN